MNKLTTILLPLIFLSWLYAGCPKPDPQNPAAKYQPGYTVLNIARMLVTNASTAFTDYEFKKRRGCNIKICTPLHPDKKSKDYLRCIYRSHAEEEAFKKCYGDLARFKVLMDRVTPLAISVIDAARASLDFAVKYERAKAADKAEREGKLKEFCGHAFPTKKGKYYRDCVAGKPLPQADWYGLLKKGACIVYNAVAFAPEKYEKYSGPVRTWAKAIGGSCR